MDGIDMWKDVKEKREFIINSLIASIIISSLVKEIGHESLLTINL
jgi:hypothetical protein